MKLLTLNCHSWQEKDQLNKIKILAQTIKEKSYDVIALQEVSQKIISKKVDGDVKKDNYVQVLLQELKQIGVEEYTYAWGFSHIGFVYYEEGLAILTRHKIAETSSFFVSRSTNTLNFKTRKIVGVKIHYHGRPISFYSCHLGWWGDDKEPYTKQVDELLAHAPNDHLFFLMGDFNNDAANKDEGYDYLRNKDLHDTYQLAEQKDSGITVSGKIAGWSKNKEGIRIDYIFSSHKVKVLRSSVIFNYVNKPVISDHYGVEVEIDEEIKRIAAIK